MQLRRIFWYVLTTVALLAGVSWLVIRQPVAGEQKAKLLANEGLSEKLVGNWEWIKTYDPYQGGLYSYPQDQRILRLRSNRTYEITDLGYHETGQWQVDAQDHMLAMTSQHVNAESTKNVRIRVGTKAHHHIKKISPKELILSRQGRHGMVLSYYRIAH